MTYLFSNYINEVQRQEHKIPKQYLNILSRDNREKQLKALKVFQKAYKTGVYIPRPKFTSFESKKSRHVVDFERRYNTKITDLKAVARVTGVPQEHWKKLLKKEWVLITVEVQT